MERRFEKGAPCPSVGGRAAAKKEGEQLEQLRRDGRGELRAMALSFVDLAYHDKAGASKTAAVRWWSKFCKAALGEGPLRLLENTAPLRTKLGEELVVMEFACWLVKVRGVAPETARKYISTVQAWHERRTGVRLAGGMSMARVAAMLRGMENAEGGKRPRRLRRGVTPQQLAEGLRRCLGGASASEANWTAALSVGLCGLLRAKELGRGDARASNWATDITRADITFTVRQGVECAVLRMRPCEKGRMGTQGKTVNVWLAGGGKFVDPVAALRRLYRVDAVPESEWGRTPLFREEGGAAITTRRVRAVVKGIMAAIGENPDEYGAHSLRIGGATAAMAEGVPPAYIKAMGRWCSEVYAIYCRLSSAAVLKFGRAIGSAEYVDFDTEFREHEW